MTIRIRAYAKHNNNDEKQIAIGSVEKVVVKLLLFGRAMGLLNRKKIKKIRNCLGGFRW